MVNSRLFSCCSKVHADYNRSYLILLTRILLSKNLCYNIEALLHNSISDPGNALTLPIRIFFALTSKSWPHVILNISNINVNNNIISCNIHINKMKGIVIWAGIFNNQSLITHACRKKIRLSDTLGKTNDRTATHSITHYFYAVWSLVSTQISKQCHVSDIDNFNCHVFFLGEKC